MQLRGVALLPVLVLLILRLVWVGVDLLRFGSSRLRIVLAVVRGLRVSFHMRETITSLSIHVFSRNYFFGRCPPRHAVPTLDPFLVNGNSNRGAWAWR
ncbi:hypothetical protein NEUTE2DRAFT_52356 [Neurospora tetrasperma FGSC 2509]|nr:hypothetical protein NEUTE2DRAFT_52356 [Neurospora tetrasperma FGSC 2509]